MTPQEALELATLAHEGQYRRDGKPYITHPIAVADMMTTDDEKVVAYLHDVVEDTDARLLTVGNQPYIKFQGVNYPITEEIRFALNRLIKDFSYIDYIKDVTTSKLATKVKIADMFHNMSDNPSEKQKQKYLEGITYLLSTL